MKVGAATHVGHVRTLNQDAFWHNESCFVVCDGMGGHQAGEVAAQIAIATIKEYSFSESDAQESIQRAIQQAHDRVVQAARVDPSLTGMGTTITMGLLRGFTLTFGHVGDSRLYVLRDQKLLQLTKDHSVVGELVRNGSLRPEDAVRHPHRNMLLQALGARFLGADTAEIELVVGDRLLFCSDGISGVLDEERIQDCMEMDCPEEGVKKLIALANEEGGPDNSTGILILL